MTHDTSQNRQGKLHPSLRGWQQLFSWVDSSSGENPVHPRIRLHLLEKALTTLQNRNGEVRKFIIAQSEAANKTNNSNQHLLDMFDKLEKVLKKNPLTNMSVTFESCEAAEIKSDDYESLKDLVSQPEPEPEEVLDKLESTMTKLKGKYKGFALTHLPGVVEPLMAGKTGGREHQGGAGQSTGAAGAGDNTTTVKPH